MRRAHPKVKMSNIKSIIKQEGSTSEADALAEVTFQLSLKQSLRGIKGQQIAAPQLTEESVKPIKGDNCLRVVSRIHCNI